MADRSLQTRMRRMQENNYPITCFIPHFWLFALVCSFSRLSSNWGSTTSAQNPATTNQDQPRCLGPPKPPLIWRPTRRGKRGKMPSGHRRTSGRDSHDTDDLIACYQLLFSRPFLRRIMRPADLRIITTALSSRWYRPHTWLSHRKPLPILVSEDSSVRPLTTSKSLALEHDILPSLHLRRPSK